MRKLLGREGQSPPQKDKEPRVGTSSDVSEHRAPPLQAPKTQGPETPALSTSVDDGHAEEPTTTPEGAAKPSDSSQTLAQRSGESAEQPERSRQRSLIAEGLRIVGELESAEDLLVLGEVEGTIRQSAERLTIGSTGRVHANIHALDLVVEGEVRGDIHCSSVTITGTARVVGDIETERLSLADGARFSGRIETDGD